MTNTGQVKDHLHLSFKSENLGTRGQDPIPSYARELGESQPSRYIGVEKGTAGWAAAGSGCKIAHAG